MVDWECECGENMWVRLCLGKQQKKTSQQKDEWDVRQISEKTS